MALVEYCSSMARWCAGGKLGVITSQGTMVAINERRSGGQWAKMQAVTHMLPADQAVHAVIAAA
jgi:hypothetical protein